MKAFFVLFSILATILLAGAATVTQNGRTLLLSSFRNQPGTASIHFRDAATATRNVAPIRAALAKRGL